MLTDRREPGSAALYTIAGGVVLLAFAPSLWTGALAAGAGLFAVYRAVTQARTRRRSASDTASRAGVEIEHA